MRAIYCLVVCAIPVLFASCNFSDSESSSTDDGSAQTADSGNGSGGGSNSQNRTGSPNGSDTAISLVNNSEIHFGGQSLTQATELTQLATEKMSTSNGNVDYDKEFKITVDDRTSVGFLHQTVHALQLAGCRNLSLQSDSGLVKIPPPYTTSSDTNFELAKIQMFAEPGGQWTGLRMNVGDHDLAIESVDAEMITNFVYSKLKETIVEPYQNNPTGTFHCPIELEVDHRQAATTFVAFCSSMDAFIQENGEPVNIEFVLWPFGYPREGSIDVNFDEIPGIEIESFEESGPPIAQPEQIPFDIDR